MKEKEKLKDFKWEGKESKKSDLGCPIPPGYYRFSKEKDALDKK